MELTKEKLQQIVDARVDELIATRRWIHEHAEIGGEEVETSKMIEDEIKKLGLPYEQAAKTGWLVTMKCGKPGKQIMLRADIDALPMQEDKENLKGPRTCYSKNDGRMHACGHDAHTAMLLTAMKALNEIKDQLSGTIYFCFEQGEENGSGIMGMLEKLDTKGKIDHSWGIHVYAGLEAGKISVDPGPRMAGSAHVYFTLRGRGGHGSRPDQSINPIFAMCHTLTALENAWVNELDVTKTVTLGIGTIKAGTVHNIIPDTCTVGGTMRFFDLEEGAKAVEILKRTVEHSAAIHRCTVEDFQLPARAPKPVMNDPEVSARIASTLEKVLPYGEVASCDPWFASESMSMYLSRYPGVFAFLGIKNDEKGTGAVHHNSHFDVDEDVLKIGAASTIAFAVEMLG